VIAFYLPGGVPVYVSALLLGSGATLGLGWVAWHAPPGKVLLRLEAGLAILSGALLGGRAAYVFTNWGYFQGHPGEAALVSLGGLAWPGALGGAFLGLLGYAGLRRQPLAETADDVWPLTIMVLVGAAFGCWLDGCAYGYPAAGWWALPARDEWGGLGPRLPLQLICALVAILVFMAVERSRARFSKPGQMAAWASFGLAVDLCLVSLLRADPAPRWLSLRADLWAALGYLLFSVLLLAAFSWQPRHTLSENIVRD